MQLTSNASINLVPPQSGDWSDVSESRVRGREQRSSQQQRRIREKVRRERETEGGKNDTQIKLIFKAGFAFSFQNHHILR